MVNECINQIKNNTSVNTEVVGRIIGIIGKIYPSLGRKAVDECVRIGYLYANFALRSIAEINEDLGRRAIVECIERIKSGKERAWITLTEIVEFNPKMRQFALVQCLELFKSENPHVQNDALHVFCELADLDMSLLSSEVVKRTLARTFRGVNLEKCNFVKLEDFARLYEFYRKHDAKAVNELIDFYNISFFGRYSSKVLDEAYEALKSNKLPKRLALVIMPKSDWNGAFYRSYVLDKLQPYYTVLPIEAGSEAELIYLGAKIRLKFGQAPLVILAGHGSPTSIELSEKEQIDITDRLFIKIFASSLLPKSTLVLFSCSVGSRKIEQNIASAFNSANTEVNLFAIDRPAPIDNFTFNKQGNIINVRYTDAPARYWASR